MGVQMIIILMAGGQGQYAEAVKLLTNMELWNLKERTPWRNGRTALFNRQRWLETQ